MSTNLLKQGRGTSIASSSSREQRANLESLLMSVRRRTNTRTSVKPTV